MIQAEVRTPEDGRPGPGLRACFKLRGAVASWPTPAPHSRFPRSSGVRRNLQLHHFCMARVKVIELVSQQGEDRFLFPMWTRPTSSTPLIRGPCGGNFSSTAGSAWLRRVAADYVPTRSSLGRNPKWTPKVSRPPTWRRGHAGQPRQWALAVEELQSEREDFLTNCKTRTALQLGGALLSLR